MGLYAQTDSAGCLWPDNPHGLINQFARVLPEPSLDVLGYLVFGENDPMIHFKGVFTGM
jgi:hypothetical protein